MTVATGEAGLVEFKSHLECTVVPGEAAYLVSHSGITALRGPQAEILAPLLDGTRTPADIAQDAAESLTPSEVDDALSVLDEAGLLRYRAESGRTPPDRAAEAYWDLAGLDGARAVEDTARAAVRIVALPGVTADAVREACRTSGLRVTGSAREAGLGLVLCDDYLAPELSEVDAEHRAAGRPWLLARPTGPEPWIGPLFRPDDGPCWSCLAVRLRGHRQAEPTVRGAPRLSRPEAALPAGRALAVQAAVLEAVKWTAGHRGAEQDEVRTFDLLGLRVGVHRVSRRPQCPVCGDPRLVGARGWRPPELRSRPKAASGQGGGHRTLSAERMLERHGHLADPVTGVVAELRRATGAPDFTQVYVSGRNLAMAGSDSGVRSFSGGKGLTPAEARAGALGEAVERYSGTRHGDEPVVRDSLRGLGEVALHPNAVQLYHERQFRDRSTWNADRSPFTWVPERFDENAPVDWTPLWSLATGTHRLLPSSMQYFSARARSGCEPLADSNGNAAGSSFEDAVLQGLLELVERDAVALWWYNRTRQPAMDLDAFAEPSLEALRHGYRRQHRQVWALDLTSDLGIPVVAALSRRTDKPSQDIVFGFGAHLDPRIALRRALTEMGQLLPAVCDARPDGSGYRVVLPQAVDWWRHETVSSQPYLRPAAEPEPRTPHFWDYTPTADLRDDIVAATGLFTARGMDVLVLDQTRPDLDVPVVKVVVPGLRHFWARYAPGRLYDVPVALGRLTEPTPYARLNPVALFV
ncbi:TOMM precursor leader peptide-binding protein [Streptomyces sp. B15]|uniref:TOMM precursor leader peptide-binding protein n=1 Tax=Streptomyces sp. B15 TaxID=1537797 RepID=UPI001B387FB1|nr:TOMM precursor leader peptide-binding protein [Streptomyces sp. B15]MBQ1124797.1 TOMM precursor leader peptide-binding protein [Streptomyces sp. B15]